MKKNDVVRLKIDDIGVNGEGIGKVDGYTLFVKDTVIGDFIEAKIMKAKKSYGYARLMQILEASPDRVEAKCPVARQCGGCQIQQMSYEKQLAFKERKVRGNLERIGGFAPELLQKVMEPICGMKEPFHYRNKAQFPIGKDKEGNVIAGFYAGRTHQIISNIDCALGVPKNQEIMRLILDFMKEFHIEPYDEETHTGLVRHVLIRYGFRTEEIMVCMVLNGESILRREVLVERLVKIPGMTSITCNINREKTNVIMGNEIRLWWGQEYITDYIGDVKYQISPLSFYQVNPIQTETLYGLALEYAGLGMDEAVVWDIYCGIGTISLFLAKQAGQVYGVEIVPQAIEDAKRNAKLNGIENAEFYVGKAEEVLPKYYEEYAKTHGGETAHADVMVVDPPRKGCEEAVLWTMVNIHHPLRGSFPVLRAKCFNGTHSCIAYLFQHSQKMIHIHHPLPRKAPPLLSPFPLRHIICTVDVNGKNLVFIHGFHYFKFIFSVIEVNIIRIKHIAHIIHRNRLHNLPGMLDIPYR